MSRVVKTNKETQQHTDTQDTSVHLYTHLINNTMQVKEREGGGKERQGKEVGEGRNVEGRGKGRRRRGKAKGEGAKGMGIGGKRRGTKLPVIIIFIT